MKKLLLSAALALALLLAPALGDSARAERRVALVVGNSAYQNVAALPNPARDAHAMEDRFKEVGFEVVNAYYDLGNLEFKRAIRKFEDESVDADIVVIYYAGHGIEIRGTNYMIPVDARLANDRDAEDEAIKLDRLTEAVEGARRLGLVILDACRDNPFSRTMKRSRQASLRAVATGLNIVEPTSQNTLIAYAAKAGTAAEDGSGEHSPFTSALLKHLFVPGLELRLAFGRVRDDVLEKTRKRQEPYVAGSLGGAFISLVPPPAQPTLAKASSSQVRSGELIDYELVEKIGRKEAWELFLKQHPTGFYSDLARQQLSKLAALETPAEPSVTRKPERPGESEVAALDVNKRPAPPEPVSEEQRAWDRIKDSSSASAFREFIKKYPNSVLANTAESRLEALEQAARERDEQAAQAAWDKIKDSGDRAAVRDFIKRHPASPLLGTAQARLDALEEQAVQAAWDKIKDSGDRAAVRDFMKRYPSSPLMATAQARLDALEEQAAQAAIQEAWNRIKSSTNPLTFRDFIKRYPSSQLAEAAQSRLEELERAAREREEQTAWNKIKDSGNPALLRDFIKRYPSSTLAGTAQSRVEAIETAAREREEKARAEAARQQAEREAKAAEAARAQQEAAARAAREKTEREEAQRKAEEERRVKAAEQAAREKAERERAETERLAKLSEMERQKAEREAAQQKAEEERRARAAEAAERQKAEREAALKRAEQERQAKLETANRAKQLDSVCKHEEDLLASLRAAGGQGWAKEDLKRLERDLGCERLRPMVTAALEKASTEPAPKPPVAAVEPPKPAVNTPEQVRAAQQQLARLGCYAGAVDGDLGPATRIAITRYQAQRGGRGGQTDIGDAFLDELKDHASRVCPLICPAGKVAEGETCVAARKPEPVTKQRAKTDDEEERTSRQKAKIEEEDRARRQKARIEEEDRARRQKAKVDEEERPRRKQEASRPERQERQERQERPERRPVERVSRPEPRVRQEAAAPRPSYGGGGGGGGGRPMIGVGF
ncbi:MAG TPA: caspase family protein [Xanthobacteraceae bacterium]